MMTMESGQLWYTEDDPKNGTHYHSIRSILYHGRTAYQDVLIVETEEWGRTLILDGEIQSTEADESIFHEALVHPAMITHAGPRSVLVLGSGEGAALREVLSYRSVERAVMADIDEELLELCAKHLPEWSEDCFEEPNVELVFDEAKDYLERSDTTFDVIIADMVEYIENGSAGDLYGLFRDRLSTDGMLVVHGLDFDLLDCEDYLSARNALLGLFPVVASYATQIPSFGGESGFLLASKGADPAAVSGDAVNQRLAERGANEDKDIGASLYFYDGDAHIRMFSLPKNYKAVLNGAAPSKEPDR